MISSSPARGRRWPCPHPWLLGSVTDRLPQDRWPVWRDPVGMARRTSDAADGRPPNTPMAGIRQQAAVCTHPGTAQRPPRPTSNTTSACPRGLAMRRPCTGSP